jgi:anion-transporting  ArsA/GET3 family ATPase
VGPVARQTSEIDALLTDHERAGVMLVTTPEQMAVSEAISLRAELEAARIAVAGVVVNRTVSSPFSAEDERRLEDAGDDPAIRSARWFFDRARVQRQQLGRLAQGLSGVSQRRIPLQFGGIDPDGLEQLAAGLA